MYTAPVQLAKGWKDLLEWAPELLCHLPLLSYAEHGGLARMPIFVVNCYKSRWMPCVRFLRPHSLMRAQFHPSGLKL
ncbi:unnamed protein product [Ranitomeya imitator]|uniref:Uncharacterized protein n=1 Tax=Ranitomeya imitator TaxID=111125 RepID=A0ABN9M8L6_9NEOB|nr:unnamed protein product [Ranitomeya imitator]